jgi:FtsP/CotA-like multicopper oxidase with cupredoxin domain
MPIIVSKSRSNCRRSIIPAAVVAASLCGSDIAGAANFVEPPVFASSRGVLDLLMIAMPQPVPSIVYTPPGNPAMNPTGWVYQICPRALATGNQCPAGSPTTSNYGGVRLALQKGDELKIRLVNRLPGPLDPIKVTHSADPGGGNLPLNLTNLHTHGLVVQARAPTMSDPTFGDYIFVEIYNSANGIPVPQTSHQHGSMVADYVDYRIDIPKNHPSGAFWFHPHVHGIALNQVSSGLSGIISVGKVGDYARGDQQKSPFPDANVRHLVLKDLQVMAAGSIAFDNGTASVANGEVLNQQDPDFCSQFPNPGEVRQGSCPGADNSGEGGNNYVGGTWFFTVSGQQFPTIQMTEPDGEIWRLTNASGSLSYDLQLIDDATQAPMVMQLVSVDGVSIDIPPSTALGTQVQLAGARFKLVACPPSPANGQTSVPVCVTEFVMMPSSRAELWVTYRDAGGHIATAPTGATGTFKMIGITTGPAGDSWPAVDLAKVAFAQTGPRHLIAFALNILGDALASNKPTGIFSAKVPYAKPAPPPPGCTALAAGHRRRIFFGIADLSDGGTFGLGYEEVDANGAPVPGTRVDVSQFDPSVTTVCLPLGRGQMPVHETWELVNLATENHNFHMHQTKFRFIQSSAPASPSATIMGPTINPNLGAGIMEDNVPLPVAVPSDPDYIANNQSGYCKIDQWYNGECASTPLVVDIPFAQTGEFVFHCHILEHEDGGMMAKIVVVPAPK